MGLARRACSAVYAVFAVFAVFAVHARLPRTESFQPKHVAALATARASIALAVASMSANGRHLTPEELRQGLVSMHDFNWENATDETVASAARAAISG